MPLRILPWVQGGLQLCSLLPRLPINMIHGAQMAVHVVWGQTSSWVVEWTAARTGMWAYEPAGWNRSLYRLSNGKHLTLLPQLVWLFASPTFCVLSWACR